MKFQRQAKILELIDRFEIETQEELTDHLRAVRLQHHAGDGLARHQGACGSSNHFPLRPESINIRLLAAGAADSFTTRLRNIFRECVTDIDAAAEHGRH